MASEWRRERAELLATIKRQQEDAERLAKRFKLLQRTLVDQQKLLDRYQQALQLQSSTLVQSSKGDGDASKGSSATVTTDKESSASSAAAAAAAGSTSVAVRAETKPRVPAFDEHRALTAANTARNTASSLLISARQVTQNAEETTSTALASTSAPKDRKSSGASVQEDTKLTSTKREVEDAARISDSRRTGKRSVTQEEPTTSTTSSRKRVPANAASNPTDSHKKPAFPVSSVTARSRNAKASGDAMPPSASSSKGDSASWIPRKADFHQTSPAKMQTGVKLEVSTPTIPFTNSSTTHEEAPAVVVDVKKNAITSNTITSNTKKRSSNERAPTWAQEKLRMQEAGIIFKTGKRRFTDLKPPASTVAAASEPKGDTSSQSGDEKENAFQYVEVVRNRDARAALPGHDCVECRKYYEALDGFIPDADMQLAKAKCSRHRARFEPYNTPDDFWCLSFPDSESQRLSP